MTTTKGSSTSPFTSILTSSISSSSVSSSSFIEVTTTTISGKISSKRVTSSSVSSNTPQVAPGIPVILCCVCVQLCNTQRTKRWTLVLRAVTAVTAGGVVGALLFIIGIEFLVILLLWKFRRLVVTNSV